MPLGQRRAALFGVLLALFAFRVAAQLGQALWPSVLLPPFEAWQSGALPYPALVASQAVILAGSLWFLRGMARGSLEPRRTLGRILAWVGGVYLAGAAFRLVAGWALLGMGAPLTWSPYLAVAIAGPLVLVCERIIPHRASWLPTGGDFLEDGEFLLLVQVAVPLGLAWVAAMAL